VTPPRFRIDAAVRDLGVRGAFAIVEGIDNATSPPGLERYRAELLEELRERLTPEVIDTDPVLAGFRDLHDRIGRSNRRFPASAEALATLFLRKGLVPTVNPVVDLYNAVSLRTRLSLGAHDLEMVTGTVSLRLTDGTETFVPLGASAAEPIPPGEYGYVDDRNTLLCRLEHRQCHQTRITPATTACFFILQGNAATSRAMLEAALEELLDLTRRHCGGRVTQRWVEA